jgi:hypothetical protein
MHAHSIAGIGYKAQAGARPAHRARLGGAGWFFFGDDALIEQLSDQIGDGGGGEVSCGRAAQLRLV